MASRKSARLRITVLVFGLLGAASLHLPGVADVSLLATAHGQHSIYIDAGCPEGSFCGRIVSGTGTFCNPKSCCSAFSCISTKQETLNTFPNVISAAEGVCIVNDGLVDACERTECQGNDCDPGPCTPTGLVTVTTAWKPAPGPPCGGASE